MIPRLGDFIAAPFYFWSEGAGIDSILPYPYRISIQIKFSFLFSRKDFVTHA